jgi:hypothetical protein
MVVHFLVIDFLVIAAGRRPERRSWVKVRPRVSARRTAATSLVRSAATSSESPGLAIAASTPGIQAQIDHDLG